MNDLLVTLDGERLTLDEYIEDYRNRIFDVHGAGFWKFERQQVFQEHGNESWDAFVRGDWPEVIRLLTERTPELRATVQDYAAHDVIFHRVRVVDRPVTTYLQWELRALRQRAECGEDIRVIGPERIAAHETSNVLPEIVVLGDQAVYQVLYDADGFAEGAIRSLGRETVAQWREFIAGLHATAEGVVPFFDRVVAPLLPRIAR